MGLDFLRRTAKNSTKAWDRSKTELSVPTLFSQQPDCQTRTVLAEFDGVMPAAGDALTLHVQDRNMMVVHENTCVGRVGNPPADLLTAIRDAGGCALGHVRQINQLSGTCDVEVK
jgi:hypothetical protein